VVAAFFADVYLLCPGGGVFEEFLIGQVVVYDHFSLFQNFPALDGQKTGVARPGAHKIDFSPFHVSIPVKVSK
jgi:hypothetical protein